VTLEKAADYVLEHGLAGLSLRPLAKALATSARMLLYDFGSKEQLVNEILAEIRRRERSLFDAEAASLHDVWRWIADPDREPFLRLFFENYVTAAARGEAELVRARVARVPQDDLGTATGRGDCDADRRGDARTSSRPDRDRRP
jgi:AcrR family transcriptional regulator